jgi:hypothetical protein
MKMVGTNKIVLNQVTMRAALQFWIDNQFTHSPGNVVEVAVSPDHSYQTTFEVTIQERPAESDEHA